MNDRLPPALLSPDIGMERDLGNPVDGWHAYCALALCGTCSVFRQRPRRGAIALVPRKRRTPVPEGEGEGGSERTKHNGHADSELFYTSVQ